MAKEKETCPKCGKSYLNLGSHMKKHEKEEAKEEERVSSEFPIKGELKAEQLPAVYREFVKPFPREAVQIANLNYGEVKGIRSQYIVERLNEVVGINHWNLKILDNSAVRGGKVYMGKAKVRLELGNYKDEKFAPIVSKKHVGGSNNPSQYEAAKGAITNAFKKVASLYGLGQSVYKGNLDEDLLKSEEEIDLEDLEKNIEKTKPKEDAPQKEVSKKTSLESFYEMIDSSRIKKEQDLILPAKFLGKIKGKITASEFTEAQNALKEAKERVKKEDK